MSEFQLTECQCCGNRLGSNFKEKEDGFVCKSCGVWFRYESNEEKRGCADGYKHLRKYQFEDACEEFESVICNYPGSIDARWGLLLARFGVVFIKGFFDNVTEPIYCFPEYDELEEGIFRKQREYGEMLDMLDKMAQNGSSESAKKALELRYFYEKKAKEIDRAIKKFSDCKRNTDREVFICVKISAATEKNPQLPGETEDCQVAKKLYTELEKRGVSTFFSYRTLKNEVNSDDLIWLNLVKSKKMILIGSERDYLESAWVKSEWKRWKFLERLEDLYVLVLKHNHEYPKEVLPHELRKSQIYTLDTYNKLLADICGEEAKESEEDKFRAAVEAEILKRKAVEEAAAQQLRKEQEAAAEQARKAQEAVAAQQARKAQEATAAEQARKAQEAAAAQQARKAQEAAAAQQARRAQSAPSIITCRDCGGRFEYSRATKRDGFIFCDFCGGRTLDTFAPAQGAAAQSAQNGKIVYSNGREESFPRGITKIAQDAYKENNDIVSVILPSTVNTIEGWAFWNCQNLESIVIPEGVTSIANGVFSGCKKLKGFTLPASLTEIKGNPFMKCNLQYISIAPGNTSFKFSGNCIYSYNGKQLRTYIPLVHETEFTVPEGVTSIGTLAFYNASNLAKITIPRSVTDIDTNAFSGSTGLRDVYYGGTESNWRKININSSGNDPLKGATIHYTASQTQSAANSAPSVTPPRASVPVINAKKDGKIVFSSGREEILPYGMTEIAEKAYYNNKEVVSVVLPSSITVIKKYSFCLCSNLKSITLPEGLISIDTSAFSYCGKLETPALPQSLENLGTDAFQSCYNIKNIFIPESLKTVGENPFAHSVGTLSISSANRNFKVVNNALFSYDGTKLFFCMKSNSDNFTFSVPEGVERIEAKAFYNLKNLSDVSLPSTLVYIGTCAFAHCEKLRTLALPQNLRELGGQVFSGCSGLETASVPEGVSKLSYCTFKECTSLYAVYLPRSLSLIDWDAFEKCSSLRDVYYSGSRSEWKTVKIGKGNPKLNGLVGKANIHFR